MVRLFDFFIALIGLIAAAPFLLIVMFLIWRQDGGSPLYIAPRTGLNGSAFNMVKLRSMAKDADSTGVASTSNDDNRITAIGHFVRRYKLDEITQLWNVVRGDMSIVGPRPNVKRETDLYTNKERKLLSIRPGITDFASIVFSDEGAILLGAVDPDLTYNQLIRPYKSRLGLFYIDKKSFFLDIQLCMLTVLVAVSRRAALQRTSKVLANYGADAELVSVALRESRLVPGLPPGSEPPA